MKVYISGKITGLPYEVAYMNFEQIEHDLMIRGHQVINPMKEVPFDESLSWKDYMIRDIDMLFDCDAIYLMDNYTDSKGAKIEKAIAEQLGLKVI